MADPVIEDVALPRLVVDLDARQREFIRQAALAGHTVRVPLPQAPEEDDLHHLEVRTRGYDEPLILLATPVGPLTPTGYPLSLAIPPPAAPDPRVGRELAGGKLIIEARVGEGAAGTVYRARHRDLRMHVAVKILHDTYKGDADFLRRFHAEALSASRLDHVNLTRVLDFGEERDGLLYLAMEYLDGKSLRHVLDGEKRLSQARALRIMTQVCSGLTHAHARSIVHRDIKPENLMLVNGLDDDGQETELVKLCDFGIAHRAAAKSSKTEPAGTPDYMSPEQFFGESPDMQSDVYACGIVFYELLTGDVPFTGSVAEIMTQQHAMEIDPPSARVPALDPRIDRIIFKALAREKSERYASVRDLRAELRTLAGTEVPISGTSLGASTGAAAAGASGGAAPLGSSASIAPSAAPAAQASRPSQAPEWLETGTGHLYQSIMPSIQQSLAPPAMLPSKIPRPPSMHPVVPTEVPPAITPLLKKIEETKDPKAFAGLVPVLEPRIRAAVEEGNPSALWFVRRALDEISVEPEGFGGGTRARFVAPLLAPFSDAKLLTALAEKSIDLVGVDDGELASKLIVRSGKGGVYALYAARLKNSAPEAREQFVANVLAIGAPAIKVLAAGLDKLESRLSLPGAADIVEDLLNALPDVVDAAAADIVARYTRSPVAPLAIAAASALANVGGRRARPILMELLRHRDARVVTSAIAGLRKTGVIDAEIVACLEPLALATVPVEQAVRTAAVEALAHPTPDAAASARALCVTLIATLSGATQDIEDLVVVAATSLISNGGDRAAIADRARKSTTWLRTRLEAILGRSAI